MSLELLRRRCQKKIALGGGGEGWNGGIRVYKQFIIIKLLTKPPPLCWRFVEKRRAQKRRVTSPASILIARIVDDSGFAGIAKVVNHLWEQWLEAD